MSTTPTQMGRPKRKVLFASGHLTDAANDVVRFPESEVPRVTREVVAILSAWHVDRSWTVVVGGARGADLVIAAEALNLGAKIDLYLAASEDLFIEHSVAYGIRPPDSPTDWVALYRAVRSHPNTTVHAFRAPERQDPSSASNAFTATNERMLAMVGGHDLFGLLVWNGKKTNRPGGTWEVVEKLAKLVSAASQTQDALVANSHPSELRLRVVDPTPRSYSARQEPSNQKRILALDGGGIRGVLSLRVLSEMERQLRRKYGSRLRLADFFDYFAGTSTGALIAAALAGGRTVEEISQAYDSLAARVFRPSVRALPRLARYGDRELTRLLENFFPGAPTLGESSFQSLLLLVMHNIRTDSPWLVTNCTSAKYNMAERLLPSYEDRNLSLPLIPLVRASTAAPTYFPPQEVTVGRHRFEFQDGGVTAFNNPALIAAVTATLPAYGMNWRAGADHLLVVSVGTGTSTAVPGYSRSSARRALRTLMHLPDVFMNGAAFSQDLLCRVFGDCVHGPPLDREIGNLVAVDASFSGTPCDGSGGSLGFGGDPVDPGRIPGMGSFFTYVRYDADLSDAGLVRLGRRWGEYHGAQDPLYGPEIRRMDRVKSMRDLAQIGDTIALEVSVEQHFGKFLPPTLD